MNTSKEYLEQADKDRFEYLSKVMKAARANGSLREVEYWHQKIEEFHDHVESRTNESSETEVLVHMDSHDEQKDEDEGWIVWRGRSSNGCRYCPVERGTLVDVKYRDGEVKYNLKALLAVSGRDATFSFWIHNGFSNDIVAYRLA